MQGAIYTHCPDIKDYFRPKGIGSNLDINDHSCFVQQDGTPQVRSYLFMHACKVTSSFAAISLLNATDVDVTIKDEFGDSCLEVLFKKKRISKPLVNAIFKHLLALKISITRKELSALQERFKLVDSRKELNQEAISTYEEALEHNLKLKPIEVAPIIPAATAITAINTSSSSSSSANTTTNTNKRLRLSDSYKEEADLAVSNLSDCVRDDIKLMKDSIDQLTRHIIHLGTAVNRSKEIQKSYSSTKNVINLVRTEQNSLASNVIEDLTEHLRLRKEMLTLFNSVRDRYNIAETLFPSDMLLQDSTTTHGKLQP